MDKDVRFTQKKVDQSWKEEISRERGGQGPVSSSASEKPPLNLANFFNSLSFQALMHLGEIPNPETRQKEKNLELAKETIDLLILLEAKTKGNLTPEEEAILKHLVPDLQMRFVQKAGEV